MDKLFTLGVVLSASDMLSPVMGKVSHNVGKLSSKIKAMSVGLAQVGTASYGMGRTMLAPVTDTVMAYQELAQAQGEVASLGIGASGIDAITKSAKQFSNQFAGTTAPEFLQASYDIKSGIASLSDEGVGEFTKLSAMTAAATKDTVANQTKLFALGYGIFRKDFSNDITFGKQFSGAIAGAVQAFRTDGADLSQGLSNIGAAASSMGVQLEEELAIIGVAKSSFNSASEAATGYRAFLDNVGKAQKDLGLEFTDSNGKMLPMVDILEKIQDKFGDLSVLENSDELKQAFGSAEAVKLIKGLIDKKGELSDAQKTLNGHMKNGTKLTVEMALAMNKGKEFEIMSQQFSNLSSTIGSAFAPVISNVAVVVGNLVSWIQEWTEENKTATKWIAYIVGGLGALLTVVGSVMIPLGALGMALPLISSGLGIAAAAIGVVGGAFTTLGTVIGVVGKALLMNPIGLLVMSIATAAYLIYEFWEPISDFFIGLWDGVKSAFSSAFSWIGEMVTGYFDWYMSKISMIGDAFNTVKGWFTSGDTEISPVKNTSINGISGVNSLKSSASTTNSVKIEVNNPSSDVDVERAVHKALNQKEQSRRNRSFDDEDI